MPSTTSPLPEESLLPSPQLTKTVTGEVDGEKKTKPVFTLSHPDVLSLMRYVWTGCFLPSVQDDYVTQLDIDQAGLDDKAVAEAITKVIKAYADIKTDNTKFRDVTWPSLVDLAGGIRKYADTAGGSYARSYYAGLVESVQTYNDESEKEEKDQDKKKIQEAKQGVIEFTNTMISKITKLQTDTQKAQADIATFKTLTTNHGITLKNVNVDVKKTLTGKGGEIEKLEGDIKRLQGDLANEQDEYDYDVKVAATTPTYAWCTIFGFIAAISVASIYGKRATDMLNTIHETQHNIDTDDQQLKAARSVSADCQRMTDHTASIITLIDSAIKTLQEMQTVWQLMKDDLKGLLDSAKEDSGEIPGPIMEKRRINGMIEDWNTLGATVKEFETTAFISEPEYLTADQFLKKYGKKQ